MVGVSHNERGWGFYIMEQGWVKIHRNLLDKGWFTDSEAVHLWVYLIAKANHCSREVLWNGKIIKLSAGNIITGRKKISAETGINQSKVERLLKLFEIEQQIEQQKTSTSRCISIRNYSKYQSTEQQSEQRLNNKRTTSEQRVNTIQELKKERIKEFKNDLITPADAVDVNVDTFQSLDITNDISTDHTDIPLEKETLKKQVKPSKERKFNPPHPAFKTCMENYAEFYKQFDRPLRITPADAQGLKSIIKYLEQLPNVKSGQVSVESSFKFILDNWLKLDNWQQKQTELRQINSRITNIIEQLKNSYGQKTTHNHEAELHNFIANLRKGMGNG